MTETPGLIPYPSADRAPTTAFGEALKNQVEERLNFFEVGQLFDTSQSKL